jgi:type IV secretory pathway component VirB8
MDRQDDVHFMAWEAEARLDRMKRWRRYIFWFAMTMTVLTVALVVAW